MTFQFTTESIFEALDSKARGLLARLDDDRRRAVRNAGRLGADSETQQAAALYAANVLLLYAWDMNGLDFAQVLELMALA